MRHFILIAALALLAGCAVPMAQMPPPASGVSTVSPEISARADLVANRFVRVVNQVEPVAESICREETERLLCDFHIMVDADPDAPANAYQTQDRWGRPIIIFTVALIADAQNEDELAFVLGHEASHHLLGHIKKSSEGAKAGAVIFGNLASASGLQDQALEEAVNLGAMVGSRYYAKRYELEADRLGTLITVEAGYNPIRGAQFFTRIPDPGERFLGSHPPNAQRLQVVRETAAAVGY
jgi:Zn-dependent protease with chaperone function